MHFAGKVAYGIKNSQKAIYMKANIISNVEKFYKKCETFCFFKFLIWRQKWVDRGRQLDLMTFVIMASSKGLFYGYL